MSEETKQDVDKTLLLVKKLDDGVELVEKIYEDGKVNMLDAVHAPEALNLAIEIFNIFKTHRKEILAEFKDIDFAEAIALAQEAAD